MSSLHRAHFPTSVEAPRTGKIDQNSITDLEGYDIPLLDIRWMFWWIRNAYAATDQARTMSALLLTDQMKMYFDTSNLKYLRRLLEIIKKELNVSRLYILHLTSSRFTVIKYVLLLSQGMATVISTLMSTNPENSLSGTNLNVWSGFMKYQNSM